MVCRKHDRIDAIGRTFAYLNGQQLEVLPGSLLNVLSQPILGFHETLALEEMSQLWINIRRKVGYQTVQPERGGFELLQMSRRIFFA